MKNTSSQTDIYSISTDSGKNLVENTQKNINFSPKAINTMITEQLVIPPARVWDRIEKLLDEQDERRKMANTIISNSFKGIGVAPKRKNLYIATFAAVGLLAGIAWKMH